MIMFHQTQDNEAVIKMMTVIVDVPPGDDVTLV